MFAQASLDSLVCLPYDVMVSDLPDSREKLEVGLRSAQKAHKTNTQAELLEKLSTVSYLQGELDASLNYAIQSIQLFEELELPVRVGGMYCGVGYQLKRRDMTKANEYMRIGISVLEQHADSAELEAAYNNYGVLKEMENLLDSAEYFYTLSLNLVSARNDSIGIPYSLNHLAGAALLKKDFGKAKQLFDRAYNIRKAKKEAYGILENTIFYGDYFAALHQSDSAIFYYESAINQSHKVGYPFLRQYCYQQLAVVHESTNNTSEALAAQKMCSAIKDSLITEKRTAELAKMETRFETAQKEKENLLLKQEKQEQELVVASQQNWIIGLVGAALIIILLGLFILQRNKRMAEAKRDAAIIEEREQGLRSIIQATENERKRIAKDLHDGIVQSLTGLSLKMQKQAGSITARATGFSKELNSTRETLDEAIAEVRGISHQMMPRVLSELGLIPAVDDMLQKSLGMTEIAFEFEHHNVENERFKETVEISLYRICQELVNNIIKHSEAMAVSVQLLKTKTHLVLIVEDNGKGFRVDDPNNQNGIGLMNINSRAQAIHGEVNYEPSPKQGTVASIRVPIS